MVVPKGYPLTECRFCHEPIATRSELSRTGLHIDCGEQIVRENVVQLVTHRGPRFEYWRDRCRAAFNSPRFDTSPSER